MGLFGVLTILLNEFNFSIKSAFMVLIFNDAFYYYKIVQPNGFREGGKQTTKNQNQNNTAMDSVSVKYHY